MKEKSEIIKLLNVLLQGEYMAVESFNNFISKMHDDKAKAIFKEVQTKHRDNITVLANHWVTA